MSRDAIAEVLGQLDYGDHPDEVDWRDRLREVDGLLAAGVLVDVDDLLIAGAQPLWHDARKVLLSLGWRFAVAWCEAEGLIVALAPSYVSDERLIGMRSPYVTAEAYGNGTVRLVWHPPSDLEDEHPAGLSFYDSADELLTWLATP